VGADGRDADDGRRSPIPLPGKLWMAGLGLMMVAAAVAVVAAAITDDPMATVEIGSIAGVERLGGIDVPDGARLVNARLRQSIVDQDPISWAVIDMPRAAAREMLTQPPFIDPGGQPGRLSDDYGQFGGKRIEAWHPDAADEWLSAWIGEDRRDAWHVIALADLDEEPARVYLLLER